MIIALSGKANSGKDTFAGYLSYYIPSLQGKSFAGKLKQIAQILTGWVDQYSREGKAHYLDGWEMTVGTLQQKLGTEAVRLGIRDDAWILALFADYTSNQDWCITDCRFPNEAEAVRKRGGILVRINRDARDDCGRDMNHPSETSLDNWQDWDFVVDNNDSLDGLRAQAQLLSERIRNAHRS